MDGFMTSGRASGVWNLVDIFVKLEYFLHRSFNPLETWNYYSLPKCESILARPITLWPILFELSVLFRICICFENPSINIFRVVGSPRFTNNHLLWFYVVYHCEQSNFMCGFKVKNNRFQAQRSLTLYRCLKTKSLYHIYCIRVVKRHFSDWWNNDEYSTFDNEQCTCIHYDCTCITLSKGSIQLW